MLNAGETAFFSKANGLLGTSRSVIVASILSKLEFNREAFHKLQANNKRTSCLYSQENSCLYSS